MSRDKLRPLARIENDATLATTEGQDCYFLVFDNGTRQKLTLQEAVKHYMRAAEEQDGCRLLWKNKAKNTAKRRTKERKFADNAAKWEEEARRLMENLPPIDGK